MDAFMSHASADIALALDIERHLESNGLGVWLDRSEIRVGALLREELHAAISRSRAFILLWSKTAAVSRWVAAELISAVHLKRFIVTCVFDGAHLPAFLQHTIYLDFRKQASRQPSLLDELCRAVREAPQSSAPIRPVLSVQSPELKALFEKIAQVQWEELELLGQW